MLVGLVTSAQAADPAWTVTPIGPPEFWANAVNDEGVVAGYVGSYPDYYAVTWADGTTTALDTPDNTVRSMAMGINNLGEVVGSVTLQLATGERTEAVRWGADGGYTLLGFLDNGALSSAYDINDHGNVVGGASLPGTGGYRGFLWDGVNMEALPIPTGPPCPPSGCILGNGSFAVAINNQGEIVGKIDYPYQPTKAVIWAPGAAPVFLPPLADRTAYAQDINDLGVVVGNSWSAPPYVTNPVVWIDGNLTDLGTLGGIGSATAINNAGLIVGQRADAGGIRHAYVWEDSIGTPLPTLEGDVESAAGRVNASGQIVGASRSPNGTWRAVMWTKQADTIPPVITVPDDITVNATGPTGARVTFAISATDDVDGAVPVTCAPETGSTFSIGKTLVTCGAEDTAKNTASASFTVTVKAAAQQLADLRAAVQAVGPGTSLADKVMAAQAAYTAGDPARTCEILNAFINQVKAQTGKSITAPSTADTLIADATRIRAVLGC